MKIHILTIYRIHNFGSVLQGWALNKFLLDNRYDCDIINFQPEYFNYGRNKLRSIIGRFLNYKAYSRRKKKFDSFIGRNIKETTIVYHNIEDLKSIESNEATVFLVGGDQLWNDYHPCGNDPAYKLAFVGRGRKIAYGTSLGRSNYSQAELQKLSNEIRGFECAMLRESSSISMLNQLTDFPIHHVIDPVGLLKVKEYERIAKKPNVKEPYAVMYLADTSLLLDKAVDMLSNQLGLKIVHICGFIKKCKCDIFAKDLGPEEILGYVMYADFVLSASFHATLFSILFNRQFASILPGTNTNARIEDLLQHFDLEQRILKDDKNLSILAEIINFTEANNKLVEFRNKSQKLLFEALKDDMVQ